VVVVTLGTPAAGVAAFGGRARGRGSRVVTVMPPDVEPVVVEVAAVRAVVEVIEATAMPSGSCPGAAPV
jgi:hypothetical protein